MFENVVAIKINILIVWSWPTMKIVDWQLFKAHKWVTASASAAWRAEREGEGGEVCRANSWWPVMCTLKIFDSIWPQEGLCHQATFFLSSTDYFLSVCLFDRFKSWYDGRFYVSLICPKKMSQSSQFKWARNSCISIFNIWKAFLPGPRPTYPENISAECWE